jgi:hypothetical protein
VEFSLFNIDGIFNWLESGFILAESKLSAEFELILKLELFPDLPDDTSEVNILSTILIKKLTIVIL